MTTTYAALQLVNPSGKKYFVSDIVEGNLQLINLPGYNVTNKWIVNQMTEATTKSMIDFTLAVQDIIRNNMPSGTVLVVDFFES